MAVAAPRRGAHRDEDGLGAPHRLADVLAEEKTLTPDVGRDELVEPRLENRDFAALQGRDLGLVLVDAGHDVAEIGETGPRDEADISTSDDREPHEYSLSSPIKQDESQPLGAGGETHRNCEFRTGLRPTLMDETQCHAREREHPGRHDVTRS